LSLLLQTCFQRRLYLFRQDCKFSGFVTVEEGPIKGNQIKFKLKDVGRISFSRDLPVHDLVREWTLLDKNTLQARLSMETLTHGMQEHTFIRYHKIAP
uniref:DUF1794 domain-containing protein n=1 Tax=Nippostrongylus brasiliensis TaxID=27835 RepID=A0A0N4YDE1_NIPBR